MIRKAAGVILGSELYADHLVRTKRSSGHYGGLVDDPVAHLLPGGREAIEGRSTTPFLAALELAGLGRKYWAYCGEIYVTEEFGLTPQDVVALLGEKENRKRLKLQKAHALQAMAEQSDTPAARRSIPLDVKLHVWQRDRGQCVSCGSNRELQYDHIIPHALGGSDTERNLQLLCADCNRRKGATLGGEHAAPASSAQHHAAVASSRSPDQRRDATTPGVRAAQAIPDEAAPGIRDEPAGVEDIRHTARNAEGAPGAGPAVPGERILRCWNCKARNRVPARARVANCGRCGRMLL